VSAACGIQPELCPVAVGVAIIIVAHQTGVDQAAADAIRKIINKKSTTPVGKSSSGQQVNAYGEKLGPGARPTRHGKKYSTRKAAKDAARQEGKTAPAQDKGHFHPVDRNGSRIPNGHPS
jgi:hypothetical protein